MFCFNSLLVIIISLSLVLLQSIICRFLFFVVHVCRFSILHLRVRLFATTLSLSRSFKTFVHNCKTVSRSFLFTSIMSTSALTVITSDDKEFHIDYDIIKQSKLLKFYFEGRDHLRRIFLQ